MRTKFTQILVVTLFLALFNFVFAEEDRNPSASSYVFYLYYDNGQLFADRDLEFKYDVIPEEFKPETYSTQFPFKGEIINLKNEVAAEFLFNPRRGNPDFLESKISVKAPYVPDGQKAVFYDAQGWTLLTIFVSESSFCNDNAVCDFETGEDERTCPNDCRGAILPSPPEPEGGQNDILKAAIYFLIVAGAALGGWFGWKWWQKRKETPLSQFPSVPSKLP